MSSRVMVLDSSYRLMSIVGWQRALTLVISNRAEVLENSSRVVRTVRLEFPVPSVIRLLHRVITGKEHEIKFSRINVFKRDNFICQYCGDRYPRKELTLDHVVPKSHGGLNDWTNIVTSCKTCNLKKADREPRQAGMKLIRQPKKPSIVPYVVVETELADTWRKWVPKLHIVSKVDFMD